MFVLSHLSYGFTGEFRMIVCTRFVREVVKISGQCGRTKSSASRCSWWLAQTRSMGCSTKIREVSRTWLWQLGLHSRPAGPWLWCPRWREQAPVMLWIPECAGLSINTPTYNTSLLSRYPQVERSTSNLGLTTPRGPLHSRCLIVSVFIWLNKCI